MTAVDDRARDPRDDAGLDIDDLAERANSGERSCVLTAEMLDRWLDRSGLGERGDDDRLRLTPDALALAGCAFG